MMQKLAAHYTVDPTTNEMSVPLADLAATMADLKNEWGMILLLDVCGISATVGHTSGHQIIYALRNLEAHQNLYVRTTVPPGSVVPSLTTWWPSVRWFEEELWDQLGIEFSPSRAVRRFNHHLLQGHPQNAPCALQTMPISEDLNFASSSPSSGHALGQGVAEDKTDKVSAGPLAMEEAEGAAADEAENDFLEDGAAEKPCLAWLGPMHPVFKNLRLGVQLSAETILQAKVEVGLTCRHLEERAAQTPVAAILPLIAHLNAYDGPTTELAFATLVENMTGIVLTDRAKAMRMMLAELGRISAHGMVLGLIARSLNDQINFLRALKLREIIAEIFTRLGGKRDGTGIVQIGGLRYDMPRGLVPESIERIKVVGKIIDEFDEEFTHSAFWAVRNKVCPISAAEAIEWGITGPNLRACGVNYDLRKVRPQYFYADVDFKIPLGINGNGHDRYLVRLEEMRQSCKIITQVLDYLPVGLVQNADAHLPTPLLQASERSLKNDHLPDGLVWHGGVANPVLPATTAYQSWEAPNGELSLGLCGQNSTIPARLKITAPSFFTLQAFAQLMPGHSLQDAGLTFRSLGIYPPEVDR